MLGRVFTLIWCKASMSTHAIGLAASALQLLSSAHEYYVGGQNGLGLLSGLPIPREQLSITAATTAVQQTSQCTAKPHRTVIA